MSEERRKILEMLAEGKVNPEEAERLLDAVGSDSMMESAQTSESLPKYLYVRVLPKDGSKSSDQVKITVPLALVRAGINFISLLPKDARADVEEAIGEKGFDFDLKNMRPEDMDNLIAAFQELEVDVETSESTVKIYAG